MRTTIRFLAGFAALSLASGAVIHALAYPQARDVIALAKLPAFFGRAFRGLWQRLGIDRDRGVARLFGAAPGGGGFIARPSAFTDSAAVALILFTTMGNFFASYVFVIAGIAALAACLVARRMSAAVR